MSAKDLRKHQAENRDRTVISVKSALEIIESDIREHGYYPHNRGRVTIKEVCRRAGIGHSTLKNPTHRSTRTLVQNWLALLKKTAPVAKVDADAIKRDRTNTLIKQVETIANKYNRFKIEYDDLLKRYVDLQGENLELKGAKADLECQLTALQRHVADLEHGLGENSDGNVIPFPGRDDTRR